MWEGEIIGSAYASTIALMEGQKGSKLVGSTIAGACEALLG